MCDAHACANDEPMTKEEARNGIWVLALVLLSAGYLALHLTRHGGSTELVYLGVAAVVLTALTIWKGRAPA